MQAKFKTIIITIFLAFGLNASIFVHQASAQTFQSCLSDNEDALFISISERARIGYAAAHNEFDYHNAVRIAWRESEMPDAIASSAEAAGEAYGGDRFFQREINRRCTSYRRGCAADAVEAIAEQTFSSATVTDGLERVVERSVEQFLNHLSRRSEQVAQDMGICFAEFLEVNYPRIVQVAAQGHFQAINVDTPSNGPAAPTLDVPTAGITGTTLVALGAFRRQIASRITGSVVSRILGRLATRSIPYIGWALLAFEVFFERDGSIPTIEESMTGSELTERFQNEIADEIQAEVAQQIPIISREIVQQMMADWRRFVADNELVLALSQSNQRFNSYLNQFPSDAELAPVRDAVALIVNLEGEESLNQIIDRNQMSTILRLSFEGRQFARETGSLEMAIGWSAIVPNRLTEVLSSDLYRYKSASEITANEAIFILNLSDYRLIRNTALLPREDVRFLSQMDQVSARKILETVHSDRIQEVITAFRNISDEKALNAIRRHISGEQYQAETLIQRLNAVGSSRDQDLAASLVFLRPSFLESFTPLGSLRAVRSAAAGDVSWHLIVQRYYTELTFILAVISFFVLLGWLRRPRRQEVVVRYEK